MKEVKKEYSKGSGFSVIWIPSRCIHSEICVKTLPKVYRPGEKPWIRTEHAEIEDLKSQIDRCPSGALAYREDGSSGDSPATGAKKSDIVANVVPGGPLIIRGPISLSNSGETRELSGNTAFCRCGASANKPFCDGSHEQTNFDS